jgi:hypothetical protein
MMGMKKWYIDGVFVREGRTYDRGYYIVQDEHGAHIEWTEPIPGGETHTFQLSECFHATGEPIMVEDGELIGELVETSVERIDIREDFPNRDEAYAILTDGPRFAFAWGPKYPYADEVPAQDVKDGTSGIEWFDTQNEARAAMEQAASAWDDIRGN